MTLSIEEIFDRLEIYELYARYVHAADDKEETEPLECIFLPHTVFDWSSAGGGKMTFEEAKKGPVFSGKLFPWSFHIYTNVRINFSRDGKATEVKVKAVNPSGLENANGKPMLFQSHGAYVGQLEKAAEGWRILNRVWHESFVTGPMEKVNGIPGIMKAVGKDLDA